MFSIVAKLLAGLSLSLKQPLSAFCDLETAHGNATVTKHGDYVSWIRLDGTRRTFDAADVQRATAAMRVELSGTLEERGHAICGFYISDPDATAGEIDRINLAGCREAARSIPLDVGDILRERAAIWPSKMRWEASYLVLWTRKAVLTKGERRQVAEEQAEMARAVPLVGDSQCFFMRSEIMAARHSAFVSRVVRSLHAGQIATTEITAHDALRLIRETFDRDTAGSGWKATLPGDAIMPRAPENDADPVTTANLLWPSLPRQLFNRDASADGGNQAVVGNYTYAHVDMDLGPEEPRSFNRLSAALAADRIPWRAVIVLEGGGNGAMTLKQAMASFLGLLPQNTDLRNAFAFLAEERTQRNHISVKMRASFATWARTDDIRSLGMRASTLEQRVQAWGNTKASVIAGDPLEGVMSSVPGLALASTGTPNLALLSDALMMLPWNRTASPWQEGSVLFRRPDGSMWPYDPSGGAMRPQVLDVYVAPPRSGKSVLANTMNLGLCLSAATQGASGANLPYIGKLDIGPTALGFVRLVQEALGPERRHLAIHVTMQLAPGYEVNIFDLQTGCDFPLPLEMSFLRNVLALLTLAPGKTEPFEGMSQLINLVLEESFRQCGGDDGGNAKIYRRGTEPEVDRAIAAHRLSLHGADTRWREVVAELCRVGEWRMAGIAQRYAVPVLGDLITAARTPQVRDAFDELKLSITGEKIGEVFARYMKDAIKNYPSLNRSTKFDFGSARIIVMDMAAVAPTGSAASDRQSEIMFMIGRHILARNFFLHPEYAEFVPEAVRAHHLVRFREMKEAVKRLDYDEWHRTKNSPQVQAQAELDVREGPKHNLQIAFASQELTDMSDKILSQSTGRFVLRAGDEKAAEEIITRFGLSEAGAATVRYGLGGPTAEGAPFLAILQAGGERWEQKLINQLGPVELWALSTTPDDTALLRRVQERVGFSEALRRLSKVFPGGSAQKVIDRRKEERTRRGEQDEVAAVSVIEDLTREVVDGVGLGIVLRPHDARPAAPLALAAE